MFFYVIGRDCREINSLDPLLHRRENRRFRVKSKEAGGRKEKGTRRLQISSWDGIKNQGNQRKVKRTSSRSSLPRAEHFFRLRDGGSRAHRLLRPPASITLASRAQFHSDVMPTRPNMFANRHRDCQNR